MSLFILNVWTDETSLPIEETYVFLDEAVHDAEWFFYGKGHTAIVYDSEGVAIWRNGNPLHEVCPWGKSCEETVTNARKWFGNCRRSAIDFNWLEDIGQGRFEVLSR